MTSERSSTDRAESDSPADHRPEAEGDDGPAGEHPEAAGAETTAGTAGDRTERAADDDTGPVDAPTGREVVLPLGLYKVVTVFSTLIAVVCVVGGFLLLDAATLEASLLRQAVVSLFAAVGLNFGAGVFDALFAVAGLLVIGLGAATYVFGTRFRAPGMAGEDDDREVD